MKISKTLALASGAVLLLCGLAALVPNPVIGQEGLLGRYAPVPSIYAGLGALLMLISLGGERTAASGLYALGIVNLIIAATAYSQIDGSGTAPLTSGLRMAKSDILFVLTLGITLILFGKMNTSRKQLMFD